MNSFKTIISAITSIGVVILHPSLNKGDNPITDIQDYVYGNSIRISTDRLIDKKLIGLKWVYKIQKDTSKDLLIFKDGNQINEIPSEKEAQKLASFYY
jgi:hypothetical protein